MGSKEAVRGAWRGRTEPSLPLTRAGGLKPLLDFLCAIGAPPSRLLRAARVPTGLLDDPEALIPLHFVHRFVETCASSQGIEDLGAVVAARTSAFDLAILGPALRRAVTVYDYLQAGTRVIGAVTSGERFWLTSERDHVRFHHLPPGTPCAGRCHEDIFCVALTVRMMREFIGPEWSPREVNLLATDDRMLGDGSVFGDSELRLGQSHSSFTVPMVLLQKPLPSAPCPERGGDLCSLPVEPLMPQRFLDSVEALVGTLLTADGPKMGLVAEAAGMSARTLQRHLRDCGRSYSQIVGDSRIQLAREWLAHTAMKVGEISSTLGYTDPANFTRAFRRTTGISPQQYRRHH